MKPDDEEASTVAGDEEYRASATLEADEEQPLFMLTAADGNHQIEAK